MTTTPSPDWIKLWYVASGILTGWIYALKSNEPDAFRR